MATNEDFETEGAYPGEADSWAVFATAGGALVPALVGEPDGWPDVERFEGGWDNDDWTDELVADPGLTENFEGGWDNGTWSETFDAVAAPDFGGIDFEAFETGWDNEDWSSGFEAGDTNPGTLVAHDFDTTTPEAFEDFEEEWADNEGWSSGFEAGDTNPGTLESAEFDTALIKFEDFEDEWDTLVFETV